MVGFGPKSAHATPSLIGFTIIACVFAFGAAVGTGGVGLEGAGGCGGVQPATSNVPRMIAIRHLMP